MAGGWRNGKTMKLYLPAQCVSEKCFAGAENEQHENLEEKEERNTSANVSDSEKYLFNFAVFDWSSAAHRENHFFFLSSGSS